MHLVWLLCVALVVSPPSFASQYLQILHFDDNDGYFGDLFSEVGDLHNDCPNYLPLKTADSSFTSLEGYDFSYGIPSSYEHSSLEECFQVWMQTELLAVKDAQVSVLADFSWKTKLTDGEHVDNAPCASTSDEETQFRKRKSHDAAPKKSGRKRTKPEIDQPQDFPLCSPQLPSHPVRNDSYSLITSDYENCDPFRVDERDTSKHDIDADDTSDECSSVSECARTDFTRNNPLPTRAKIASKVIRQRIRAMLYEDTGYSIHNLKLVKVENWPEGISIFEDKWTREEVNKIWCVLDKLRFVFLDPSWPMSSYHVRGGYKIFSRILTRYRKETGDQNTSIDWSLAFFDKLIPECNVLRIDRKWLRNSKLLNNQHIIDSIHFVPFQTWIELDKMLQDKLLAKYRLDMNAPAADYIAWESVYVDGYLQDFRFKNLWIMEIYYCLALVDGFKFVRKAP